MASYKNPLNVHNEWGSALLGVWIYYYNGDGKGTARYFDVYNPASPIPNQGDIGLTTSQDPIVSREHEGDFWTISLLDAKGQLWGTKQDVQKDIPRSDGTIEISLINEPGDGGDHALFIMPGGSTSKIPVSRR